MNLPGCWTIFISTELVCKQLKASDWSELKPSHLQRLYSPAWLPLAPEGCIYRHILTLSKVRELGMITGGLFPLI